MASGTKLNRLAVLEAHGARVRSSGMGSVSM